MSPVTKPVEESQAVSSEAYSYDEVPYASHPFGQTHPDRLATIAALFGVETPAHDRCRVLELGCAGGGNLLPIAEAIPDGQFVGVDLSAREIEEGQATLAAAGLTNVALHHKDIMDVDEELGEFDYILCHGVFSWVPAEVKDKILDICASQLAPQGVAYISYNTYPGWHLRGTVRDIMEYHARRYDSPPERVKHARALLDFLVKSVPIENNPYGLLLKDELDLLSDKADFYIYHEHLEKFNEPMYFYQFVEQAGGKGLRFLGESDFGAMSLGRFPDQVAATLRHLTDDFEEMEQYMDFVRNRMFRQTLLVRQQVEVQRTVDFDRLGRLYVTGDIRLDGAPTDSPARFAGAHGVLATGDPLLKIALLTLSEFRPEPVLMDDLANMVMARFVGESVIDAAKAEVQKQQLMAAIVDCYAKHFVELSAVAPRYSSRIGERPRVTALARYQAYQGHPVTNLCHQMVALGDLPRRVVALLDGEHTRDDILRELEKLVADKALLVHVDGKQVDDAESARPMLEDGLERSLRQVAADGLLLKDS